MAPTTKKNNTSIETETFGRRNGALKTCGIQVDTNDKRAPRVGETAAQSPRRLRRHRKPADDPITADPTVNQPSQVQRSGTSRIPSTSRRDESNYSAMTKRRRRLDLNATRNKYGQHQLELRQPVKKPHVLHVISEHQCRRRHANQRSVVLYDPADCALRPRPGGVFRITVGEIADRMRLDAAGWLDLLPGHAADTRLEWPNNARYTVHWVPKPPPVPRPTDVVDSSDDESGFVEEDILDWPARLPWISSSSSGLERI